MSENTRLMSERRRERTNTNKCWLATGLFVESHIWHVYWIAQTAYKFRQLCMVDGCLPFFSSSIFPNSSATLKWKPSRIPEAIVAIVIMHVAKYSMTSQLKRSYSWFYHRRRSKHSWHCNLIRGYFSFLSQCWANALSIQVMSQLLCPLFTLLASALGKGRERKKYLKMFLKQSQQNFGALLHHENASICKSCGCILHGRRTAVTRATLNKHTSY